jgi:RNA polymerase sigma factor (sigma-70 family)
VTQTTTTEEESKSSPFLEDGRGHINPELAQRIYTWEQEQGIRAEYRHSTREGLRWVQDLVAQLSPSTGKSNAGNDDDLIQEGVIALMQSMTKYEHDSTDPNQTFEDFAKERIRLVLQDYQTRKKSNNKRGTLSMESTVKIADPFLGTHYTNQDEWEVREGLVLDNGQGKGVKPDQLVEEFLDEALQYEGEDQMWVHQQQVAAPLRDSIPEQSTLFEDSEPTPDDLALTDMIRFNVDEFLGSTLEEDESQVIQMRFGFDTEDSNPMTQKEVAFELGLSVNKVRKLQTQALEKLRLAYAHRYVGDEEDHLWEDSV